VGLLRHAQSIMKERNLFPMPEIIFNGPEGRLEGRYHHSKRPNAPLALVLHPDPQLGGTMNNVSCVCTARIFCFTV
jgi:alpha/beta superfamily hydrolase